MSKKIVIVGGVAGGASAAARLRRLDEDAHIIMFERESEISIANCGLPYYIGDSIKDRAKLLVQTPEAMKLRFNLDVRTESEVTAINPERKTVSVRSRTNGEYEESYDALILSPGARPLRPSLPGIESTKIFSLRNIPDTDRIKTRVIQENTRTATIIGGGFIGVEMAENLKELGLDVTLVEGGSQILAPFDPEMSSALAKEMEEHGVKLLLNQTVASFREAENQIETVLASGYALSAEMVILAIGVTPDTSFLKGSGIELGPRGHIIVNSKMETNLEHVYAAGDAVEITDFVTGARVAVPLAGPANKQGRIAADNVCGLRTSFKGTQGTSIIKVFGMTGASTGANEKTLRRLGLPFHISYVHPSSHASYYPGASQLALKLLFGEDGTILGAQATGFDGVDKRIDDIATAIHFRGKVSDLTELELAYAPPYSSAKDPVNMAGYTAENILTGKTDVFVPADLGNRDTNTTLLVDVRTPIEHANGHIPGSIHIQVDDLRDQLQLLDRSKEIWVYCQVGLRGYTAARILQQKGFKVRNLTGGFRTYQMANYKPAGIQQTPPSSAREAGLSGGDAETEGSRQTAAAKAGLRADVELDACGLCCPGPLVEVKRRMDQLSEHQVLHVTASDPGFYEDIQAWGRMSGNEVLQVDKIAGGRIEAYLQKAGKSRNEPTAPAEAAKPADGTSMVVFSGELDKAIASFIIANGAAASGKKVTMFFTFWGLNVIRKPEKIKVAKSFMGRMFGVMMPRGSRKLPLSRMNMMGAGAKMIRGVMKGSNISSLEELMETAIQQGVEVVACQMSMDVMGIKTEELMDGVKIGGVGYYLGQADQSGINLFI